MRGGGWTIPWDKKTCDEKTYPKLTVSFDVCSNIMQYKYFQSANSTRHEVRYPLDDWKHPEKVKTFEQQRYDLVTIIMERHPPPKVQVNEFNMLPGEIHCNKGIEPYIHNDGNIPMCLKPQTYEGMLDRGFDLEVVTKRH